jgi:hypothetical protein
VGSRKVDIAFSEQGTSHRPTASAFDASTGEPVSDLVEILADEEHLWGGDQLALVTYHDITQIIHLKDMRHPVSTFLPSGKRACAFRPAVQEQIGRRPLEPALCRQLAQGKGPESLEFSKPTSISREETGEHFLTASVHDRLMALQLADPSNRYPTLPCGNAPKFSNTKERTILRRSLCPGRPIPVLTNTIVSGAPSATKPSTSASSPLGRASGVSH